MAFLPVDFPFRSELESFLEKYLSCVTYWYVPKTRTLNDENVGVIRLILGTLFEEFLDRIWDPTTQDEILTKLIKKGILVPTTKGATLPDRTALIRIWKKLLETFLSTKGPYSLIQAT